MQKFAVVAALFLVASCGAPIEIQPVVSQYNGDSVSIQLDGAQLAVQPRSRKDEAFRRADAEAARICQKGHKKTAEFTSTRTIPQTQYSHVIERLYLCLN